MTSERFGPYLLGPLLGRGGMGEVHRATDTSQDGRTIALKRMAPHLSTDQAYRDRFRRECEAAARLDDPHVVPIHRYGEIDGRLFLDMQLVDGRDLATELTHTGPIHPARAVGIITQLASALDAAHAADLVHRDVKPSNVLLTAPTPGRPDFAQLTDFGIAAGPTGDGGADGTVEYLAPERLFGAPADHRVDIYSLACVLHELLTGLRAFPGADFAAQVHGHLYLPPPRPSETVGGIPPGLDLAVARGMAKDPAHRHPTAGALADEATGALGPAEGSARPERVSRRRLLASAAGAAVLAGGGALGIALTRGGTPPGSGSPIPVAAGPPPEPVLVERVLGVRSASAVPFTTTQVGGKPAAFISDMDYEVHLRDLTTDRDIARAHGSTLDVARAEVVEIDGRDVLAWAGYDGQVSTGDMQTRSGSAFGVHEKLWSFAAASAGGRAIAATTGLDDGIVRRWDLRSRTPLGDAIPVPEAAQWAAQLSTVVFDGRLCLVAQVIARNLTHVWDAETAEPVARTNATGEITLLDGVPVVVSTTQRLDAINLRTGEAVRRHDIGGGSAVSAVAVLDGRPVVATQGDQDTIVLRDVDTGAQLGAPLAGHQAALTRLGVADLNGRPVLVSAARDNTIRVWDLAVRAAG